jgi:light-regulated signal transduction histidine kinase (bacteriophytochrome)
MQKLSNLFILPQTAHSECDKSSLIYLSFVHLDTIENVDFNEVLKEVKSLQRRKIEELKGEVSSDKLPVIDTYKSPIIQVFHNFIGNALNYSDSSRPPRIHVGYENLNKHHRFSVSDNGIGIESEFHDKNFIIFQRLHTKEQYFRNWNGISYS